MKGVNMIIKRDILFELRERRELECFPIINRGFLWYERLTQEQLNELETWYQKWLDVTITGEIPVPPNWINDKTHKKAQEEIRI